MRKAPPVNSDHLNDLYGRVDSLTCEIERDERKIADGPIHSDERRRGGRGSLKKGVLGLGDLQDPCTATDLAAALSKSPKTIIDWCQEREYTLIPCFKIGNRWYHRPDEVKRWLKGIQSGQVEFRRKPRSEKGT